MAVIDIRQRVILIDKEPYRFKNVFYHFYAFMVAFQLISNFYDTHYYYWILTHGQMESTFF